MIPNFNNRTILCKLASSKDIFYSLVWGDILENMIWKLNDEKLPQTFQAGWQQKYEF